jgi:hypothetical protein
MYTAAFGQPAAEFGCQFNGADCDFFEEFDQEIREAPIDRPYEFCSFIKNAGGEEKKIMDFKTGTWPFIQEPPRWPSSLRRE